MCDMDHCFGCKFSCPLFDMGPNGRMLVQCECEEQPDGVLQWYEPDFDMVQLARTSNGWIVEEKYSGCKLAKRPDIGGVFVESYKQA